MSGSFSPQWRPEPQPSNDLERLLQKAATDPAYHGQMMRALWDSELNTLIEYHPELEGGGTQTGTPPLLMLKEGEDVFIPVFSSDAVADYCIEKNGQGMGRVAMAGLPGSDLFQIAAQLKKDVILNPGMTHRLKIGAEAVAALVRGDMRHSRPDHDGPKQSTRLIGMPLHSIPSGFLDGVRRFCKRTPTPIAVYLFMLGHPETGKPVPNEWRLILRLRSDDNDFYNDFGLLASKLLPKGVQLDIGVVTGEDAQALDFLQKHRPLWPVISETS